MPMTKEELARLEAVEVMLAAILGEPLATDKTKTADAKVREEAKKDK